VQARYLLVGDLGGTHCALALYERRDGQIHPLHEHEYASANFANCEALLDDFLSAAPAASAREQMAAMCLSVAGPVEANATVMTNLGWHVGGDALSARYAVPRVCIVNDFAAVGHGIARLRGADLVELQRGRPQLPGVQLVVGAGTGLGMCILVPGARRPAVLSSEGGHADFAPANALQDALLVHLREAWGQVSYERLVSGSGLLRIFDFLCNHLGETASTELAEAMRHGDPPAAISAFAVREADPLAVRALDLFIEIYGAFAGTMALATLACGGVYLGGGIARKLAAKLTDGIFVRAFADKGRYSELLRGYPVYAIADRSVALKGALSLIAEA
jgi:glucokinase